MKIILSAINTKFTHKALSLACLKSYWDIFHNDVPLTIKEFDLNILNETIINDLLLLKPDVLAFSTYIWSIERILAVSSAVISAFPQCIIILGGPFSHHFLIFYYCGHSYHFRWSFFPPVHYWCVDIQN